MTSIREPSSAHPRHRRAGAYRSDPRSRILFFSRLRASASTCSFHRSLFHSGPTELLLEPNGAGLRLVGEDSSEPRRRLGVASRLGIGLSDLVVGMAHLRTVGDLSGGREPPGPHRSDGRVHIEHAAYRWVRIWASSPIRAATAVAHLTLLAQSINRWVIGGEALRTSNQRTESVRG